MANLVFLPIADQIESGSYFLHDCACGTGGMLTVAEETLLAIAKQRHKEVKTLLYGQEINPETYAICKADMILKGEGDNAKNIFGGAEYSTLSHDAFPAQEFNFMLANPPYGKSWKKDLEQMGGKDGMRDPRFKVMHKGEELSLVTRSSDGQLLFLANMASKMDHKSKLGSRIAEVHNGSSLFTGDAGQGESNIRRWFIENDWVEAIVALPLNLFYNTGIATYVWVLTNRKPEYRKGKIQLIDATQWFKPLRKNLGKKNCELSPEDIQRICDAHLAFEETEQSKIFLNEAFGYWKVVVERPLRLHSQLSVKAIESLRFASGDEDLRAEFYDQLGEPLFQNFAAVRDQLEKLVNDWSAADESDEAKGLPEAKKKKLLDPKTWERDGKLVETANLLRSELGGDLFEDHNLFRERATAALEKEKAPMMKRKRGDTPGFSDPTPSTNTAGVSPLFRCPPESGFSGERPTTAPNELPPPATTPNRGCSAADLKLILRAVSWRVETAPPVIAKIHKPGKTKPDPLHGLHEAQVNGKPAIVEYETDADLRDTEQVPLLEPGGIQAFIEREVLPYTPDAWIDESATKIGYEVSFTRHFYKPQPLRTLEEIRRDILAVQKEAEGLIDELVRETVTT